MEELVQILTTRVPCWVIGQKSEDKQQDKERNHNINDDLEGFHLFFLPDVQVQHGVPRRE
jgi:hypothetical protein